MKYIILIVALFSCKMKGLEYTAGRMSYDTVNVNNEKIIVKSVDGSKHTGYTAYPNGRVCIYHKGGVLTAYTQPHNDTIVEGADTIINAQIDQHDAFTDTAHNFIIRGDEVYFKTSYLMKLLLDQDQTYATWLILNEEFSIKQMHQKMLDTENKRIDSLFDKP